MKTTLKKSAKGVLALKKLPEIVEGAIESEIDKIVAKGKARMMKADTVSQGEKPVETEWLTREEFDRLEELKEQLPQISQAEARGRVKKKREARRKAQVKPVPEVKKPVKKPTMELV